MFKMWCSKLKIIVFLLLAALALTPAGGVIAQPGSDKIQTDKVNYKITGDVYFGDKNLFSAPAVIKRDKVFAEIPAYKTIKKEKLDKRSARYFMLLEQANKEFREKVKETAEKLGYDLVVEKGKIKAEPAMKFPNITKDVIDAI